MMRRCYSYNSRWVILLIQHGVAGLVLTLAGGLLGCVAISHGKSNYEVINTGIKGGGCWLDDQHFVVEQRVQIRGTLDSELDGLYVLDPAQPKVLKPIDLSPIEPTQQRQIRDLTCQQETILFDVMAPDQTSNQLYTLKLGQPPVLLAERSKGFLGPRIVNVKNQYVLSFSSILKERGEEYSARPEAAKTDCPLSYLRPPYRVVCLRHNRGTKQFWVANNILVTKYLWDETIRIGQEGAYKWVPNPEPPLRLPEGTELKQGYLLRDLENRIVTQVKIEQPLYQIDRITMTINPQGDALYAACFKAGDHGIRRLTGGGRICRFAVDGVNREWTEVVAVQQSPQDPLSLQYLDVNRAGDVVALQFRRGARTIWKHTAATHRVDKVRQAPSSADLGSPKLSPTGQWVSFSEQGTLHFLQDKGVRP